MQVRCLLAAFKQIKIMLPSHISRVFNDGYWQFSSAVRIGLHHFGVSRRNSHCLPDLAKQSHLILGSGSGQLDSLSPFNLLKSHPEIGKHQVAVGKLKWEGGLPFQKYQAIRFC